MNRRQLLGGLGAAALGALAGCNRPLEPGDTVTEVFEDSFGPGAVASLAVENDIGDVTVRARDVDGVAVRVVKRSTNGERGLDDIRASTALEEGALTVETQIDRDANWFSRSSPSTDTTVTVPQGSAGPTVASVESRLGDVTLLDTRGDTTVDTDLGDVTLRRVDGYPSVNSRLGWIAVTGTTGLRHLRTNLGEIDAELRSLRNDVDVRTEIGDVRVSVDQRLSLDVVARSNGSVAVDLGLSDRRRRNDRVTGQLNGGGRRLRAVSDVGTVSLRPLAGDD